MAFALPAYQLGATDDVSRPNYHLGYTDSKGQMLFWRDIGFVALEGTDVLPVRLRFNTAPSTGGSLFGRFWFCPLLESTLIPKSEKALTWINLGGRTITLRSRKDGTFTSGSGKIVARKISSSEWTLISGGWTYRYVSGKLRGIRLESGEELEWTFLGSRLEGIFSSRNGRLLALEYAGEAGLPMAMTVGKTRYTLEYQQVPLCVDLMGQIVIAGYVASISRIHGGEEGHNFPILLERNAEYFMDYSSIARDPKKFRWGALDGLLKSDGTWDYRIDAQKQSDPIVSRTDSLGRFESYFYDSKKGISEHLLPDGTKVVRTYFVAAGPTHHKIRKSLRMKDGQILAARQWSYDEVGNLIRDRTGNLEFNWVWGKDGNLLSESESFKDELIRKTEYDPEGRITSRAVRNKIFRYSYDSGKKVIQKIVDGQVVSCKVIGEKDGIVAFFENQPSPDKLDGLLGSPGGTMSGEEFEKARSIAQKSITAFKNESSN